MTCSGVEQIILGESEISGRGVFAVRDFNAGEVVEVCEVLIIPKKDIQWIDKTELYDHYYAWSEGRAVLALGLGSMYNHSYNPNCKYRVKLNLNKIEFKSLQAINNGQELLINYNRDPKCQDKVWFDVQ
jgi:SET domain-containing protein